jgi:CRP/FNR family nitrogen fixation transcriptional regulator
MLTRTVTPSHRSASPIELANPATTPAGEPGALDLMGAPMSFGRNSEIYSEDEPTEFIYKVVSGSVRVSKLLADGRRQISGFYLPGDMFGIEAGEKHRFSAEAIADTTVLVIKRRAAVARAEHDAQTARQLWTVTAQDLDRAQEHMLLLGRKNAAEKVAAFLLDMAVRSCRGLIELPMSRYDIADYLGLTIETVSRTLSALESRGLIEVVSARRIAVKSLPALRRLDS